MLLVVPVTAASADDGTTAPRVPGRMTAGHLSRLAKVWADGTYHNHASDDWLEHGGVGSEVEVVSRPVGSSGSVLLHRRWVVERRLAWLGRCRRNGGDYELYTRSGEAWLEVCSIHRVLRLLSPDRTKEPVPFKYRE